MAQGIYNKMLLGGVFPGTIGSHLDADFAAAGGKIPAPLPVNVSGTLNIAIPTSGTAFTVLRVTKTGNITGWSFTGGLAGYRQQVDIEVAPGAGGFTETIPTSPTILWPNGTPPTPSTSVTNIYHIVSYDGFVTKYGYY